MPNGIKIKINCDIRGAEKAMKQLDERVASLQRAERKVGNIDANYRRLGEAAKKAYADAEAALKKYQDAEAKAQRRAAFIAQATRAKNPNATQADIDRAVDQDASFFHAKAEATAAYDSYRELTAQAEALSQKHERLAGTLRQARSDLAAERMETQRLKDEINNTDFILDRFKDAFKEMGRRIADGLRNALTGIPGMVKGVLGTATTLATNAFRGIAKAATRMAQRVGAAVKAMMGFRKAKGPVQGATSAIIKLGTMLKMLVIRQAMRAMVKAAKEGFENLARYSTQANANMSALMSSMTRLKNSFATAFAPILTTVTPALTALINKLSEAASAVAALFAALSGAKTFTKATEVTEDYAASLGDANKQGEKSKKTFAFDNLNQLQGGAAGGYSGPTPAEMFEEVNVPEWISNLVGLIKEEDWEGLGEYISGAINKGMTALKLMISWEKVEDTISPVIEGITSTLNSLVNNINWSEMGAVLGTGVNTLVNTLYLLLTRINWYNLGRSLSIGLNAMIATINWIHLGQLIGARFNAVLEFLLGAVRTFDWAGAGRALAQTLMGAITAINWGDIGVLFSTFLIGALTFLYTAVENFDWFTLGEKVKTMLVNIDWTGIFTAMFEVMGATFGALLSFIWGLLHDAWETMIGWWHENAIEDGKFTIEGLLYGIVEAMRNIFTWIAEHVLRPIVEGFCKAFGIHSPSTVMAELGGYLIDGLKEGLSDLWEKIKGFFTEAIDNIRNTFSIDNLKEVGANAVTGLLNGLKSVGNKVKEWGTGVLNGIKDALGIHSPSKETEAVGEYTVAGYINGLNNYNGQLKNALSNISSTIINAFMRVWEQLMELQNTNQRNSFNRLTEWLRQMSSSQSNAQQSSYASLNSWTNRVKELFRDFYSNLTMQTNSWATSLQATLNRMVAAAQQAAREIAMANASSASSSSSLSAKSAAVTSSVKSVSTRGAANASLKVPAYATGKVLPANNPHLAIVGDQRQGDSIETQMGTMVAAFRQAMQENGGGSNRPLQIDLYLETGARLGRALIPSINEAAAGRSVTMTARGGGY